MSAPERTDEQTAVSAEPFPADGADVGPTCRRCAAANEAGAEACRACGAFLSGNGKAVIHAGYARELFRRPEAAAAMAAERADVARDLGGDLSVIQTNVVDAYVQTRMIRSAMFEMMTRLGIKGKAFDRFVAVLDREARLAQLLGLSRRQKHVDPLEAVRRAVAEANQR